MQYITINNWVEERVPLKQGLKPQSRLKTSRRNERWRKGSTKTRIETNRIIHFLLPSIIVEERVPLKQGLKLLTQLPFAFILFVEERVPLKQGLKPVFTSLFNIFLGRWRKGSTKTRIETYWVTNNGKRICPVEERVPLKQGLKQSVMVFIGLGLSCWRKGSTKTRIETRPPNNCRVFRSSLKKGFH